MTAQKTGTCGTKAGFLMTLAAALLLLSPAALAQPVAGCDQQVLDAMEAKGDAVVAYKVAGAEEMAQYQPDSILAMTCFSSAAGNSAAQLGSMFSGDYTAILMMVIPDSLTAIYDDFPMSLGTTTGTVDYSATALNTNMSNCPALQDVWQANMDQLQEPDVPFPRYEDYLTGTMPAGLNSAGPIFTANWNTSNTANAGGEDDDFGTLNNLVNGPPASSIPKWTGATTLNSTAGTNRACDLMIQAGIAASCP